MKKEASALRLVHELALSEGVVEAPTDITLADSTPVDIPDLVWKNYGNPPAKLIITNTGHTVNVGGKWESNRSYLRDGPFKGQYVFAQMHFHWGPNDHTGSEHSIDGHKLPMELHVVHINRIYRSQEMALREKDGVAIVSYLFQLQNEDNPDLKPIVEALPLVTLPQTSATIEPIPIGGVLVPFHRDYLMYWGSVSSPTCQHLILWLTSRVPLGISSEQLTQFRQLRDISGQFMVKNFREAHPRKTHTLFHVSPSSKLDSTLLARFPGHEVHGDVEERRPECEPGVGEINKKSAKISDLGLGKRGSILDEGTRSNLDDNRRTSVAKAEGTRVARKDSKEDLKSGGAASSEEGKRSTSVADRDKLQSGVSSWEKGPDLIFSGDQGSQDASGLKPSAPPEDKDRNTFDDAYNSLEGTVLQESIEGDILSLGQIDSTITEGGLASERNTSEKLSGHANATESKKSASNVPSFTISIHGPEEGEDAHHGFDTEAQMGADLARGSGADQDNCEAYQGGGSQRKSSSESRAREVQNQENFDADEADTKSGGGADDSTSKGRGSVEEAARAESSVRSAANIADDEMRGVGMESAGVAEDTTSGGRGSAAVVASGGSIVRIAPVTEKLGSQGRRSSAAEIASAETPEKDTAESVASHAKGSSEAVNADSSVRRAANIADDERHSVGMESAGVAEDTASGGRGSAEVVASGGSVVRIAPVTEKLGGQGRRSSAAEIASAETPEKDTAESVASHAKGSSEAAVSENRLPSYGCEVADGADSITGSGKTSLEGALEAPLECKASHAKSICLEDKEERERLESSERRTEESSENGRDAEAGRNEGVGRRGRVSTDETAGAVGKEEGSPGESSVLPLPRGGRAGSIGQDGVASIPESGVKSSLSAECTARPLESIAGSEVGGVGTAQGGKTVSDETGDSDGAESAPRGSKKGADESKEAECRDNRSLGTDSISKAAESEVHDRGPTASNAAGNADDEYGDSGKGKVVEDHVEGQVAEQDQEGSTGYGGDGQGTDEGYGGRRQNEHEEYDGERQGEDEDVGGSGQGGESGSGGQGGRDGGDDREYDEDHGDEEDEEEATEQPDGEGEGEGGDPVSGKPSPTGSQALTAIELDRPGGAGSRRGSGEKPSDSAGHTPRPSFESKAGSGGEGGQPVVLEDSGATGIEFAEGEGRGTGSQVAVLGSPDPGTTGLGEGAESQGRVSRDEAAATGSVDRSSKAPSAVSLDAVGVSNPRNDAKSPDVRSPRSGSQRGSAQGSTKTSLKGSFHSQDVEDDVAAGGEAAVPAEGAEALAAEEEAAVAEWTEDTAGPGAPDGVTPSEGAPEGLALGEMVPGEGALGEEAAGYRTPVEETLNGEGGIAATRECNPVAPGEEGGVPEQVAAGGTVLLPLLCQQDFKYFKPEDGERKKTPPPTFFNSMAVSQATLHSKSSLVELRQSMPCHGKALKTYEEEKRAWERQEASRKAAEEESKKYSVMDEAQRDEMVAEAARKRKETRPSAVAPIMGTGWPFEPFHSSKGTLLSPIDISLKGLPEVKLNPLVFDGHFNPNTRTRISNTGETVEVRILNPENTSTLHGGPLSDDYIFDSMHFHWSNGLSPDNPGSVHKVDGQRSCMEVHLLHYRSQYSSKAEALKHYAGLCAVAIMFSIGGVENEEFARLSHELTMIDQPLTCVPLDHNALLCCKPSATPHGYVAYPGTLIGRKDNMNVIWIVYPKPVGICCQNALQFQKLRSTAEYTPNTNLSTHEVSQRPVLLAIPP